jgi:hypothetical protein
MPPLAALAAPALRPLAAWQLCFPFVALWLCVRTSLCCRGNSVLRPCRTLRVLGAFVVNQLAALPPDSSSCRSCKSCQITLIRAALRICKQPDTSALLHPCSSVFILVPPCPQLCRAGAASGCHHEGREGHEALHCSRQHVNKEDNKRMNGEHSTSNIER